MDETGVPIGRVVTPTDGLVRLIGRPRGAALPPAASRLYWSRLYCHSSSSRAAAVLAQNPHPQPPTRTLITRTLITRMRVRRMRVRCMRVCCMSRSGWCGRSVLSGKLSFLPSLLTHLLTHSLTHLLTYSLTHSLTYSLTYLLTYSLTYLLAHLLTLEALPANESTRERPLHMHRTHCTLTHAHERPPHMH